MSFFTKTSLLIVLILYCSTYSLAVESSAQKETNNFEWTPIIKSSVSSEHYFWGLQLLLIAAYETLDQISTNPCTGIDTIMPIPLFIQDMITQFAITKPVLFCLAHTKSTGVALDRDRFSAIILDKEFYNEASLEEKQFVVAHELAHIKNNHTDKKAMLSAVTAPLVILSVLALDKATQTSIDYIKNRLALKETGYFARFLSGIQKGSHLLSRSPLFHWGIIKYCNNAFSRKFEREADRDAALSLQCTQGGISFFKNLILKNKGFSSQSAKVQHHIDKAFGWLSHPCHAERISDLQKLA
jgi:Peptidase family M48